MVHYFYDLTADKRHTQDAEGNLVQLCPACAMGPLAAGEIIKAQRGDAESICEADGCEAANEVRV